MVECDCKNWARDGKYPLTVHHPKCEKYDPVQDMVNIVSDLIKGIEAWAADCDGIHPCCWDAYSKAKFVALGQIDHLTEEKIFHHPV